MALLSQQHDRTWVQILILWLWWWQMLISPTAAAGIVKCKPCLLFGNLMHRYDQGVCKQSCVLLGIWFQTDILKCGPCPDFEITLKLDHGASLYRSTFLEAKKRWESVITGDLKDQRVSMGVARSTRCRRRIHYRTLIDDLLLCAMTKKMDGPGKVVATAAPEFVRIVDKDLLLTPYLGYIEFDNEDIGDLSTRGILKDIITHEMGRVLGIGPLWDKLNLVDSQSKPCAYSERSFATETYRSLSGCTTALIPIEEDGSDAGLVCQHWQEQCFSTEIMTGYIDATNTLSVITVAGLEDLGYQVDFTKAEPTMALDASCICPPPPVLASESAADITVMEQTVPQLSDAGRQEAIAYGRLHLSETKTSLQTFSATDNDNSGFVGGHLVSVIYEENGNLFSVVVTN